MPQFFSFFHCFVLGPHLDLLKNLGVCHICTQIGWCYMWMFVTHLNWCHNQHFLRVMIFAQFSKSTFPIYLMILCTPIPTIFFSSFPTWGFPNHFVGVMCTTRWPFGRNVVCFNSFSHSSPYINYPPYLCFPFVGKWYTYSRFCIRCGLKKIMIVIKNFNIQAYNAVSEMCSLVFTRFGPLYITSFWFFYS
jgi:hypothetical protein